MIGVALLLSAFGLIVAIPAVIAFNFFTRKMRTLLGSADECAHVVLAMVHGAEHGSTPMEPRGGGK